MEIYRFRTTYGLLDGHNELEKQEIYFASPDELNDPMEGFRDIFWKGDDILWRNLLKNYLFCLEHIYLLTIIAAEQIKVGAKDIPLFNYPITNYPSHRLAITGKVRKRFFERPAMNDLPAQLANRQNAIRHNELLSHLMFVHQFAIKTIEDIYLEEGMIMKRVFLLDEETLDETALKAGNLAAIYNQLEAENDEKVDKLEIFFQVANGIRQGYTLSSFAASAPQNLFSNTMFIINDFDEAFINKLETLIYPDWYSASFLTNCKNSAIWGYYGDYHKGVCLIYQPQETNGVPSLDIRTETGYNTSGPTIGFQTLTFRKVNYDHQHIEIDFFRSLGRSPAEFLESTWYRGENGELSPYGSHLQDITDEWRKNYWDNFQNSLTIKIKEWEYEQEYRLTIAGFLIDYSEKDKRKLEYKFEDLKGIIFGIKTSPLDKMKIITIIKEKCRQANRKDFEFYQAYYSRATRQIERQQLSLIDFNSNN